MCIQTCSMRMRTVSSLAGSVPTNLACVTASDTHSTPSLALGYDGSATEDHCFRWTHTHTHTPTSPYAKNLLTADIALPVIGPVVSSDWMMSQNGFRNSTTFSSLRSLSSARQSSRFDKLLTRGSWCCSCVCVCVCVRPMVTLGYTLTGRVHLLPLFMAASSSEASL